ncbi:MAG TPA: hypothetical protein VFB62_22050, partial [Polyangiaceae bacterium]|nr:hypothetical protein [Polyangiaceae bacterium]
GFATAVKPPVESTFDLVLRDLGHALFPWSAFLPFAFGRLFQTPNRDVGVRVALLVGASVFYAVYAFVAPRSGPLPFAAPAVLAAIAAVALDDFERGAPASALVGAGTAVIGVVLLHDFATIPQKLLVPFGVRDRATDFVTKDSALLMVAAGSFFVLMFFGWIDKRADSLRSWIRTRVDAYRTGSVELQRVWKGNLVFGFLVIEAGLVGLGAMLIVGRKMGWPSVTNIPQQTANIGLNAWWFLPLALLMLVVLFDVGRLVLLRLPRAAGMLLAAIVAGGLLCFGFYPALASQLSPRGAFRRYAELHRGGEPLATLGLRARVVRYYARGEEPHVLVGAQAAADWLDAGLERSERRWLVVRDRDLSTLNALFRKAHGQNLPVLDASTGEILLASNSLGGGASDNPLDAYLLQAPPERIQHPVSAMFGDDLEALGWEIRDDDGDLMRYVVPGRAYTMRFFYRVRRGIARNYQAFLHVDGYGRRHNGDHEVLDGRYRMTLWQAGDVIADPYELTLEANFLPGDYHVLFGFFSGKPRYPVTKGEHDEDRVFGGVLSVR